MKKMINYLDRKGYLIQKSSYKTNMIDSNFLTTNTIYQKAVLGDKKWFDGKPLSDIANGAMIDFRDSEGVIRRYHENYSELKGANPQETNWYKDPRHVSRDNSMGYIMMLGKFGYHDEVRKILFNIVKRGSFFQNTHSVKGERKPLPDLCGPEQYSVILRASTQQNKLLILYPLILFLDLFFFLSILVHTIKSYYDPTHTSTIHHELSAILQAKDTIQTPFSWLAEKIFLKYRLPVKGYPDKEALVSCVKYYSRSDYDPPIYETTSRVVEYLRKRKDKK